MPGRDEHEPEAKSRLFIALPVPTAVKDELCHAQVELQAGLEGDGIRWTKPEQIHLTLRFLGNVADSRIDELITATRLACASLGPVQLRAEGFGFFPEHRLPRIVWAKVHDEGGKLASLAEVVTNAVSRFAAQDSEKAFSAHLTLGRIRNMRAVEVRYLVDKAREMGGWPFGNWTAETVEIVRSHAEVNGLQYSTLAEIPLRGKE